MKDYKMLLISFVLLIFMIGAVSANDADSILTDDDPGAFIPDEPIIVDEEDDDSNIKEIYVKDTGDDSNDGSENSPYATIGRAVEDVTEIDEATIHIGEGTFASDGDSNLNIYLMQQFNGNANLKFIGAGADKTIIDAQDAFYFANFGECTNITLKDITFINCKGSDGGAVSSYGILNVENCIFKDCYSLEGCGGAIHAGIPEDWGFSWTLSLNVKNSQFINCFDNSVEGWYDERGGGAIYAGFLQECCIDNNTFIGTSVSEYFGKGAAVLSWMSNSKIINNKFINITGYQNDAGLAADSWMGVNVEIINNTFINCSNPSDEYAIVYLGFADEYNIRNNTFINSENPAGNCYYTTGLDNFLGLKHVMDGDIINVGNNEINEGAPISISATDDNGNKFALASWVAIEVNLANENNSYSFTTFDNKINFNVVPENGVYNLTVSDSDVLGIVNINASNDPFDLYISPDGSDADEGTVDAPFATIQHAIDVGFEKSFTVVVHLLKGTYSGEGNVMLTIANKGSLQLIGEKYNETVIDGNNTDWLVLVRTTQVTAENLTFSNGKATSRNSVLYNLFLKDCIVDGNDATGSQSVMDNVDFENLIYTNNKGHINIHKNEITISDCYFANNNCSNNNFGVLNIESWSQPGIVENCIFINNTAKNSGAAIYSDSPLISRNNYFEGNSAPSSAVLVLSSYYVHTFENDTYINNKATAGNGGVVAAGESDRIVSSYQFNNCRFINNSAVKGGAIAIVNGNVSDSEFINNTADYGGAVLIVPVIINQYEPLTNNGINFENVTFDNNVANVNGHDLYFGGESSSLTYDFGCLSLDFKFNDLNVSSLTDTLTVNVTAPFDAVIGGGFVDFELNGTKIGTSEIINGIASFNYPGFEEGVYVLGGKSEYGDDSSTFTNGTVTVKFESILDNIEYWVSSEGSDEDGNGSEANPFNSISYAINKASKSSRNILIHISEGTFAGDLNTALELSSLYNITLSGAGVDKTIIDGENSTYFATVTEGSKKVTISDLTIKNMLPDNRNTLAIDSNAPITVNEGANLLLDNVEVVDNHGGIAIIVTEGNLAINNSVFRRNGFTYYGVISGVDNILGRTEKGNVSIDNTLFEDNFAMKTFIAVDNLFMNNSEIKNTYLIFNYYDQSFDLINFASYATSNSTILNTKISHDGNVEDLNNLDVNTQGKQVNPALNINGGLYMNNCSVVNNFNGTLNSLVQVAWIYEPAVFGYAYMTPKNVSVYNSSFVNFKYLWMSNAGIYNFILDGCSFENFEKIAFMRNANDNSVYNITNSAFVNCTPLVNLQHFADQPLPTTFKFNDNYWGSNNRTTIYFLGNSGIRPDTYTPDTWIVLFSEDEKSIIKNVTDGENSTNYTGCAPIRVDYADNNGLLDYALVIGETGYWFTTDEDDNVIFNPEDAMYPFVAVDPMNYRDNAIMDINKINGSGAVFGSIFDVMGNPVANATVVYTLDGVEANTTTDENGSFVVFGGNGDLNITFIGDDSYFPIEKVITLENIAPVKTESKFDLAVDGNLVITGTLSDINGNKLANVPFTYVVNGTEVNATTDANGAFAIEGLSNDTVEITFIGDDSYLATSTSLKLDNIAPTRIATVIESDYTFTRQANDYSAGERGDFFYATLKDINGNPISNVTCYVAVNGPIYNVTTDENGKFGVQVNLAAANTYTYALSFLGNEKYEASLNCSKLVLTAKKTTISAKAKAFKAKAKTKTISVTLSTVKNPYDGKTYLKAGKKLTMKLNGKTYTAKINAKGVAKFTIKLTKKGKYSAKITFAGDKTYKASSKTIKVTIK